MLEYWVYTHCSIIPLFHYSDRLNESNKSLAMNEIFLKVYLQPKSSKNEVVGPYRNGIKVKVTAPPVEGKANEALIRVLARALGVSPFSIEIIKGHRSREKTLKISGTPRGRRI